MPKFPLAVFCLAVFCFLATRSMIVEDSRTLSHKNAPTKEAKTSAPSIPAEIPPSQPDPLPANPFTQLADSLFHGELKKGSAAYETLSSLFLEWGAADPHAAMAYLEQAPKGKQRFAKAVLRGWAQSGDFLAARVWIQSNIAPQLATPFYAALIDGLGDIDRPEESIELALSTEAKARPALLQRAIENWASQDLAAASRWIEANESSLSPREQNRALGGYAKAWAKKSPAAASSWAQSLPPGRTRDNALLAAFDEWVQRDATKAGYWIFSQKPDESIKKVLSENAHLVAHVNPQVAFEFIENDPANEEDPYRMRGHLAMALDNVMHKAPAAAAPYIKRVEAQTLAAASEGLTHAPYQVSNQSYVEMVNRWAASDEDAAFAYLDTASNLSEADREAIKQGAIDRLQTTDPDKAAYYLYKRWQDADQVNALQFAASTTKDHLDISVSNIKSHYQSIAQAWAKSDPETVGYYLERQEILDPEETAELLVAIQPFDG
ncbi:hypothetical protein QEH56_11645 [Pelagicoccus enzymogenes]|uniref:hypothetical protein n=1 Tax=Pelagicoccus enzymogenes TaxID=2773457 RepID=UPI00280D7C25|nr:hypothetical protein [Pelagicoccus enzymogenes]MDQ8198809.1 hypothetical protein [Pelagicoccus enzymogenes]